MDIFSKLEREDGIDAGIDGIDQPSHSIFWKEKKFNLKYNHNSADSPKLYLNIHHLMPACRQSSGF